MITTDTLTPEDEIVLCPVLRQQCGGSLSLSAPNNSDNLTPTPRDPYSLPQIDANTPLSALNTLPLDDAQHYDCGQKTADIGNVSGIQEESGESSSTPPTGTTLPTGTTPQKDNDETATQQDGSDDATTSQNCTDDANISDLTSDPEMLDLDKLCETIEVSSPFNFIDLKSTVIKVFAVFASPERNTTPSNTGVFISRCHSRTLSY